MWRVHPILRHAKKSASGSNYSMKNPRIGDKSCFSSGLNMSKSSFSPKKKNEIFGHLWSPVARRQGNQLQQLLDLQRTWPLRPWFEGFQLVMVGFPNSSLLDVLIQGVPQELDILVQGKVTIYQWMMNLGLPPWLSFNLGKSSNEITGFLRNNQMDWCSRLTMMIWPTKRSDGKIW